MGWGYRSGATAHLVDLEGLDPVGVGHVRAEAQIDERAAPVDRRGASVGDLFGDEVDLERVVLAVQKGPRMPPPCVRPHPTTDRVCATAMR